MNRFEVVQALMEYREGAPMITSPGLGSHYVAAHGDFPMTIYNMDMPYTTPMALGVALGWPERKVVSVDGDGSLLAGPGVLTTIARYRPRNLIVIVFDNQAYLTTGSGRAPTATATGTDIEGMGRTAGIERSLSVTKIGQARTAIRLAFQDPGPWLIVAKVDKTDREQAKPTAFPVDVYESGVRFRKAALEEIDKSSGCDRGATLLSSREIQQTPLAKN